MFDSPIVPVTLRNPRASLVTGDALPILRWMPEKSVHAICTSPPYWRQRIYGSDEREIGREKTPEEYIERLVEVFREARRVLRDDGTCWVVIGDAYAVSGKGGNPAERQYRKQATNAGSLISGLRTPGLKAKDIIGLPYMLGFALRADGWIFRKPIVWKKPNSFPESCKDRPTSSFEIVLLLAKTPTYFWDGYAIREDSIGQNRHDLTGQEYRAPGQTGSRKALHGPTYSRHRSSIPGGQSLDGSRQARDVWAVPDDAESDLWSIHVEPSRDKHFAMFPTRLASRIIAASTPEGGCCSMCGEPMQRVLRDLGPDEAHRAACGADLSGGYAGESIKDYAGAGAQNASETKRRILAGMRRRETIGWQRECRCWGGMAAPAVVLDPFGGAMTTALTAGRAGRDSISIDLLPEFLEIGRKRLENPETKCLDSRGERMPFRRIDVR